MQGGYLASTLSSRGEAYLDAGQVDLALSDATRGYQMARKVQGSNAYSCITGDVALLLARAELERNDTQAARKWAHIAYQQLQGSVGENHPKTIKARKLMDRMQPAEQ
jgi:hypothetical protein